VFGVGVVFSRFYLETLKVGVSDPSSQLPVWLRLTHSEKCHVMTHEGREGVPKSKTLFVFFTCRRPSHLRASVCLTNQKEEVYEKRTVV